MMCYSHATIFYGLFVRSFDLVRAVDAWTELEPTFKAVDLIELRRSNGTLEAEGAARAADVPSEVWSVVKQDLAALEVEEAQVRLLDQLRCSTCQRGYYKARSLADLLDCDVCRDNFYSGNNVTELCFQREKALVRSLASYRLYLPGSRIVTTEPYFSDWDALSGIAFSLSHKQQPPSAAPESNDHHAIIGHELQPFDP